MRWCGAFRRVKSPPMGRLRLWPERPRNARFVGYALHSNPEPGVIPCHRVVFRDGSLAPGFAFGGSERQRLLLEEEGVVFISPKGMPELSESGELKDSNAGASGLRVDLARCQWDA